MTETSPVESPIPHDKKAFGRTYWMLNTIEMFERLAYFGIRAVVPIYIMQATEPGGLHLTAIHKGWIYMWWAIMQSWLPMFTGGIADRYGYKKTLFCAVSANVVGYIIMASFHSYFGFFAGILVLASGTAFFKPALQGSIAQNLTKENSSMGWGVFYWVVNIGAFAAPFVATLVLGKPHSAEGWQQLFLLCAGFTCVNLFVLLTFKDVPSGADKTTSLAKVFAVTVENIWPFWFRNGRVHWLKVVIGGLFAQVGLVIVIFKPLHWAADKYDIALLDIADWQELALGIVILLIGANLAVWLRGGQFEWQLRLPAFLLIMSCFWMMMYQLWDLQPNFIEDWIDSSMVAAHMPFEFLKEYGPRGLIRVPQQILLNLNAGLIILLILPLSWLVRKMRTLSAMMIGMSVATGGILVAGLTGNGWILLLGILFFSLGEMLTGPKKNQYLGLIAPPGKKGLYLGYVNIPIGLGVGFGSMIAGYVYDQYGEKATLALKELAVNRQLLARASQATDWSDSLEKIPPLLNIDRDRAFATAQQHYGKDAQATAQMLRRSFRYDEGQVVNLALQYLALHSDYQDRAVAKLGTVINLSNVAGYVDKLPEALGVKRVVAFEMLQDMVNKDRQNDKRLSDSAIVEMLWKKFGSDSQTLNNLALEYLAQSSDLIYNAVANMSFESSIDSVKDRITEIEERIGLGRTKSFAALSAAKGADGQEVRAALNGLKMSSFQESERVYAYLMVQPHHQAIVVGRKDWTKDVELLRQIVRPNAAVREIVLVEIDKANWWDKLRMWVKKVFGAEQASGEVDEYGIDYVKLADKQDLIQKALAVKDWSQSPEQAAQLLGLSLFEARALVAADVNHSPVTTTRLLWDTYKPQYCTWVPFAAIGVLAMIALAIFGQMAKRWPDMNA